MNEIFLSTDLAAIEVYLWQLLKQSVQSHNTPFHNGVVATMNGGIAELRTVILRNVHIDQRKLFFNTDIRSSKVQQLLKNASLSWLFYNEAIRVQLRIYAHAAIHKEDDMAEQGWERSRLQSRLCYSTQAEPGSLLIAPELIDVNRTDAEPSLIEFARSNFAVIETSAYAMDWVFLHNSGNRRAFFDYETNLFSWKQV